MAGKLSVDQHSILGKIAAGDDPFYVQILLGEQTLMDRDGYRDVERRRARIENVNGIECGEIGGAAGPKQHSDRHDQTKRVAMR